MLQSTREILLFPLQIRGEMPTWQMCAAVQLRLVGIPVPAIDLLQKPGPLF